TCHCTLVRVPGTVPADGLPGDVVRSAGASLRANVPVARTAMFAGGCAGAGPASGFSGWKRTSGAVASAAPLTRKRCGRARGRGDAERRAVRADRPLPVERDAPHRAAGHRTERVPDEEEHRAEERDGRREGERAHRRAAGGAHETRGGEGRERSHTTASAVTA